MQQRSLFDSSAVGAAVAAPIATDENILVQRLHLLIAGSNGVVSRALQTLDGEIIREISARTTSIFRVLQEPKFEATASQTLIFEVVGFRQRPENLAQLIAEKKHRSMAFVGFYSDERSRRKFESWIAEYTRIYGCFRDWNWHDINSDGRGSETKEAVVRRIIRTRLERIRLSSL